MVTDKRHPKALRKDPIIEATFEVRFKPAVSGLGDLFPGALYPRLKDHYERVEALPAGEIPKAVRDRMPNSAYQGTKRLVGDGTALNIADQSIAVLVSKPYWGWERFRPLIFQVISTVNETGFVGEAERISFRYQNLLTTKENPNDFSGLQLQISVADYQLRDGGLRLRAEIEHAGCVSIIQVVGSAEAVTLVEGKKKATTGMLLDIDTIKFAPLPNFWTRFQEIVENVHIAEKEVFFSLLKGETIEQMDPVWE